MNPRMRKSALFAGVAILIGAAGAPVEAQDPPVPAEQERQEERAEQRALMEQRMDEMISRMVQIGEQAEEIDLKMGEQIERLHERLERLEEEDVDRPGRPDRPQPPDAPEAPADEPGALEDAILRHEQVRGVARDVGVVAEGLHSAMERVRRLYTEQRALEPQRERDDDPEAPETLRPEVGDGHRSLERLWEELEEAGRSLDQHLTGALRIVEGFASEPGRDPGGS